MATAVIAIVAVVGCGGKSSGPVAVHVGDEPIEGPKVAHWATVVERSGDAVAAAIGLPGGTSREKALDFLISADWLIGEAAARGRQISDGHIERQMQERIDSVPNGRTEFEKEISATGRTTADVKLEIKAESAAATLRAMVSSWVPPATRTEVATYYGQHGAQFRIRALRIVDLVESIPTRNAAIELGKHIGSGKSFASRAFREQVASQTPYEAAHDDNHELVRAIFQAQPGKVAGPVRFARGWVLIVVRKVVPASIKPLAAVAEEIATRLTRQRQRLAMSSFIKAYRSKWTAKTNCLPGYIVQKCSQYHGPMTAENNPLSGS